MAEEARKQVVAPRRMFQETNLAGRTYEQECARVPLVVTEMWKAIIESSQGIAYVEGEYYYA
jgi:hypothetical protein